MCRHVELHHGRDETALSRALAGTDLESFNQNLISEESDATRLEMYNETMIGERPPRDWGLHCLMRHFVVQVEQPTSFTNAPYEYNQSTESTMEQGSADRPSTSAETNVPEEPRRRRGALVPRPDESDSGTPQG